MLTIVLLKLLNKVFEAQMQNQIGIFFTLESLVSTKNDDNGYFLTLET